MSFIDTGSECLDSKCEELLDMADWASRGADASLSTKERLLRFLVRLERWKGRVSFSPSSRPQSRLLRLLSSVSFCGC